MSWIMTIKQTDLGVSLIGLCNILRGTKGWIHACDENLRYYERDEGKYSTLGNLGIGQYRCTYLSIILKRCDSRYR